MFALADVTFRRSPAFSGLEPGAFVPYKQIIPIDIVLIGFDPDRINRSDLAALLPATSTPVVRYPRFYGLNGRGVGLEYESNYSLSERPRNSNRDNMYRWETAGYLNWANALAGDILANANASAVFVKLVAADALAAGAKAQLDQWNYLDAVERARSAYLTLVSAAGDIGVSSARLAAARTRLPASQIRRYVCRPRQLIERVPQEKI